MIRSMWRVVGGVIVLAACSGAASTATAPASGPEAPASAFAVTSPVGLDGGTLPTEYTCDGAGVSPALTWTGVPQGTREFVVLMTTVPGDGSTKWNWVLYGIPASATGVPRAVTGLGTEGRGSDGPALGYQPPCSQGPGLKLYTFTVYAVSAAPVVPVRPFDVTGDVLSSAIASVTLAKSSLTLGYTRPR